MFDRMEGFMPKNCMSGYDFELRMQELLTGMGFNAKLTKGNDNGVDVIATITEMGYTLKFYIQCKFYNKPVGKTPIQEIYTGCQYFGGDGHPVVITNNRMSSETKAYAHKLGVEVITEYQFNELSILKKTGKIVNDSYTGLMGIMISKMARRADLFKKSVESYNKKPVVTEEITDKEALKIELLDFFDQANLLMQESAELQMRANACQQQAMSLQKEALLRNLNCL